MSATSTTLRVLISGAGVAGPVAAYWLAKAGHHVTVIDRAPCLRKEGQTVDIRQEGLRVIEWMGIRALVDERTTKEAGMRLVDDKEAVWAAFGQSGDKGFTSEVEIVRGELSNLFYEISRDNVTYLFDTTIDQISETDGGVRVTWKGQIGGQQEPTTFDVIIVAEGLYSRTRAKAFQEDIGSPVRSLDFFSASFSLPANESDTSWADWRSYSKRRMVLSRPDGFGRTRVSVGWFDEGSESRTIAHPKTPIDTKKAYIKQRFQDLDSPALVRFFDGLAVSDDLYLAEIGQTKAPSWSRGRVVLLGDTAFCPSALTGMGTTSAIAGAYILAAELVRNPTDPMKAFAVYEKHVRPWVEKIQKLPPGWATFSHPDSRAGVVFLYWTAYMISLIIKLGVFNLFSRLLPSRDQNMSLPPPSTFDRISKLLA